MKADSQILKYAIETFESNPELRMEANNLMKQAMKGSFKAGRGSKVINSVFSEMRGYKGARVYYRMKDKVIEILGYSNKSNQTKVIQRLIKLYGE